MNTASIRRTVWALIPLWLVLGLKSVPCQAQQRAPGATEAQELREIVRGLERENQEMKTALRVREQEIVDLRNSVAEANRDAKQLEINELQKSQREAIAALQVVHAVRQSQAEVIEMQRALLVEVRQLRELFQTVHGKTLATEKRPLEETKPVLKRAPNDPFNVPAPRLQEKKPASKPAPNDPFNVPAPRLQETKPASRPAPNDPFGGPAPRSTSPN